MHVVVAKLMRFCGTLLHPQQDLHRKESCSLISCRLYVAQNPTCTHGYALRNATVAAALLRELGHDVADSVDLVMARILEVKRDELPSFVMLPPPIAQLYRTSKHQVCCPALCDQCARGPACMRVSAFVCLSCKAGAQYRASLQSRC